MVAVETILNSEIVHGTHTERDLEGRMKVVRGVSSEEKFN